jgi:hypothetical protein
MDSRAARGAHHQRRRSARPEIRSLKARLAPSKLDRQQRGAPPRFALRKNARKVGAFGGGHPLDLHQGEDARLLVGDQRPEAPRPLITEPNGRAVRYLLDGANLAHASPSSSTTQGEFTMKRLLLAFVTLAVATAFTAPAFAGILDAKNKTECEKAGGVWVEKDNKCGAKKQ